MRLRSPLLPLVLVVLSPALALGATKRAQSAEPVVEELMGGCSLKCSVAWQVEILPPGKSQGTTTKLLNDESARAAWVATGEAVGTRFRLRFPKKFPSGMSGEVPLYGFDLINGNWADEDQWKQWGRLKRARFYYNDRVLFEASFPDTRRWAKLIFDDIMLRDGDSLTVEVLEVYPGTRSSLALTEFVLQGAH